LHAELPHLRFRPLAETGDVRKTHPRPEFAHASSHKIGVFFQLRGGPERPNARSRVPHWTDSPWRARSLSKSLEIEHLPSGDLLEHTPHFRAITRSQLLQPFQQTRKMLDQRPFRFIPLERRK
jgi:hypothetical protein